MQYPLGLTREYAHSRAFSELAALPNPAAGGGFAYRVSGLYWERLASLSFVLTTNGTAGARQVQLNVLDGDGATVAAIPAGGTQAASLARLYSWLPGMFPPAGAVVATFLSPLPDVFLQPDWTVSVTIDNVKAGDQVSAVRLYRERFSTGRAGYLLGPFSDDGDRLAPVVEAAAVLE
jgi:hypothetical protein